MDRRYKGKKIRPNCFEVAMPKSLPATLTVTGQKNIIKVCNFISILRIDFWKFLA